MGPHRIPGSAAAGAAGGIVDRIAHLGAPLGLDPRPLLAQRAADAAFVRSGDVTCGGAGRLLAAADGLVAVTLAREEDVEMVPAWLEVDDPGRGEHWAAVTAEVAGRTAAELVDRASLLGLPVAAEGEVAVPPAAVGSSRVGDDLPPLDGAPLVVDLSSLWAGPLCTRLLADRGPGS